MVHSHRSFFIYTEEIMTTTSTLTTTATYNDDRTHRYLLTKLWDESKPRLAIIMLSPSTADEITFDTTTMYILSNAVKLGYGSVDVLNLYPVISMGRSFILPDKENTLNTEYIVKSAASAETVILAPGTGCLTYRLVRERQESLLEALQPYESKLMCIADKLGSKFYHPLCPAVREWKLVPFTIDEVIGKDCVKAIEPTMTQQPKKKRSKTK